jgi:hypothetical protein
MLLRKFDDTVRQTLARHGVQDEKLELILIDLFKSFEQRILSDQFVDEITKKQDRKRVRALRAKGLRLR